MAIEGLPTETDAQQALNRLPVITQGVFADWRTLIVRPELFLPRLTHVLETRPHEDIVRLMQSLSAEDAYTAFARVQYHARFAFTNDTVTEEHARKDAQVMLGFMRLHIAKNYRHTDFNGLGTIFLHDMSTSPFREIGNPQSVKTPEAGVSVWVQGDTRNLLASNLTEGIAVILQKPSSDNQIVLAEAYARVHEDQQNILKKHGMHRNMRAIVIAPKSSEHMTPLLVQGLIESRIVSRDAHITVIPVPAERISVAVLPQENAAAIDFHDGVQHAAIALRQ